MDSKKSTILEEKPKYKLIYFNRRGHAEIIRLIFVYCDVFFEDYRVDEESWKEMSKGIQFILIWKC